MNKIALCYGVRLGMTTRWRMYKLVLRNMSISGAAELATDVFSQLGAGVTGILSARAGEGILAGRFLTKLGLQIAVDCRPVPFTEENRLSYGSIAKAIVTGVRGKEQPDEGDAGGQSDRK